jgi:hypothetical protein
MRRGRTNADRRCFGKIKLVHFRLDYLRPLQVVADINIACRHSQRLLVPGPRRSDEHQ